MKRSKIVESYFNRLENSENCKKWEIISGEKYSLFQKGKRSDITRFFIDNNLDVSICKFRSKMDMMMDYTEESDLLIIGFCLDGEKIIDYNGRHKIAAGDVFYFRPEDDYRIQTDKSDFLYYFLDLSCFGDFIHCSRSCNCKKSDCSSYMDNICERGEIIIEKVPYAMEMYSDSIREMDNLEINNFLDYTNLKGQLFSCLNWFINSRLGERKGRNKKKKGYGICYGRKARKIIEDNLEDHITVSEIADILDISEYRLQNSFKKVHGTTVYDYMRRAKILRSKNLLRETKLSVMDIAHKIGYENPSKFSTTFKEITGYTPTKYRKEKQD